MRLTDALQVIEVLLWLFVRLQLFVLVGNVHPSIFHDLLAKGKSRKKQQTERVKHNRFVDVYRSVVSVSELPPLSKTLLWKTSVGLVSCC